MRGSACTTQSLGGISEPARDLCAVHSLMRESFKHLCVELARMQLFYEHFCGSRTFQTYIYIYYKCGQQHIRTWVLFTYDKYLNISKCSAKNIRAQFIVKGRERIQHAPVYDDIVPKKAEIDNLHIVLILCAKYFYSSTRRMQLLLRRTHLY